jgi:hypothetical protein
MLLPFQWRGISCGFGSRSRLIRIRARWARRNTFLYAHLILTLSFRKSPQHASLRMPREEILVFSMFAICDNYMATYQVETTPSWKPVQTTAKKSIKFTKKITYVDDMMIHNLVIFISHKRSRVWTRYFTRLCIIISSTYVIFLLNLYDFFAMVCTDFHEECVFHPIRCLITLIWTEFVPPVT